MKDRIYKENGKLYLEEYNSFQVDVFEDFTEQAKPILDNDLIVGVWRQVGSTYKGADLRIRTCELAHVTEIEVMNDSTTIIVEFVNGKFLCSWNSEWGGIFTI